MEYPIIDTLTNAYIQNGWTGLEFVYGKNLAFIEYIGMCPSVLNGQFLNSPVACTSNYIEINANNPYTISIINNVDNIRTAYIFYYDSNNEFISWSYFSTPSETFTNIPQNAKYIYLRYDRYSESGDISNIQFESGTEATPYEPYKPPTTDIFSRTRLPLIRYFPHPVIDSLQRASDGTMTADDVQVLRHYLTKFGIGNIELGRFHAINPNVSDDIREIDLEQIPIDEPIKEKKTGEEDLNVKTE